MVNRPKVKGTAAETAVKRYLQTELEDPTIDRMVLSGSKDRGDITNLDDWTIEVKNCAKLTFSQWLKELYTEVFNGGTSFGAVWAKKRGTTDPGEWYVTMDGKMLVKIMKALRDAKLS